MFVALSEDQEFFRETTARFLAEAATPDALRALRDDAAGFEPGYWRQGAELGWTSLLVAEEHGGGTISGPGLVDLSLVAYEFGQHAAPGPLVATNVVASALSAHGSHPDVLRGLLDGTEVATWPIPRFGPGLGRWRTGAELRRDGDGVVLNGTLRPVESAGQAGFFLVSARDADADADGADGAGGRLTQVLVPASAPGVSVTPMQTVDLTRRFGAVAFEDVRLGPEAVVGTPGEAAADVARQFQAALVMLDAEAVGAMQAGFDMTVEWSFDRYTFGRPLASYQALKHRFADMMAWLEASHAISDSSCLAAAAGEEQAGELLSAAKAFIGQYGAELLQDCVQIHGGIGVTFEHDLHLFLRRFTVNRSLAGAPAAHRQHIALLIEAREEAAA
jgi:alkylation response protein AidB-like acyl-CoA dehydrogenase